MKKKLNSFFLLSSLLAFCISVNAQNNNEDYVIIANHLEVFNEVETCLKDSIANPQKSLRDWLNYQLSRENFDSISTSFSDYVDSIHDSYSLNNIVDSHIKNYKEHDIKILINDLRFKLLVKIQFDLEKLYSNLPPKNQFKNAISFASINSAIADTKTYIFYSLISSYSNIKSNKHKYIYWTALGNMLVNVDLEALDREEDIVNRSPYGINVQKGEIVNKLVEQSTNEENGDVKLYANKKINQIKESNVTYKPSVSEIIIEDLADINSSKKINEAAIKKYNQAVASTINEDKIRLYTEAIEIDSNLIAAYNNRGISYYESNQYNFAVNDFLYSLSLDSNRIENYMYLGNCYLRLEDYQNAIDNYSKLIYVREFKIPAIFNRGICYQKMGNYNSAIQDYSNIITTDSSNFKALSNRAQCFLANKNFPEAIKDFTSLIVFEPDNDNHFYNLGCLYWKNKNWGRVVEYWEKSLSLNPNNESINKNIQYAKKQLEKIK